MKKLYIVFLTIFCLLFSSISNAQWSNNSTVNTPVSVVTSNSGQQQMVADGAGGTFIAWVDYRSGTANIYAQHFNAAGIAQWTTNGIAVAASSSGQAQQQLVSDGNGGIIVVWVDGRNTSSIYTQHLDLAGTALWATGGVEIHNTTDADNQPVLAYDGNGGAVIAWTMGQTNHGNNGYVYFYATHINSSQILVGGIQSFQYNAGVNYQYYGRGIGMLADGSGGAFFTYSQNDGPLVLNHISSTGTLWNSPTQLYSGSAGATANCIISDGAGGSIVCWSPGNGVYAQRCDASGNIQWTNDGVNLVPSNYQTTSPQIITDGSGGAILTWMDYRSNSNWAIYSQRINSTGSTEWTTNGVAICNVSFQQLYPQLVADDNGGAIITWQDNRNGAHIYARKISSSGSLQWTPTGNGDGVGVCTYAGGNANQANPQIVTNGSNGAIISFTDYRQSQYYPNLYAQSLNADGTLGTPSSDANLSSLIISSGTLVPTFSALTTSYSDSVSYSTTSITVTPTTTDANATVQVKVNSGTYATVANASASSALALSVGSNTITVKVTAQDGNTIRIYTIAVTRSCLQTTSSSTTSACDSLVWNGTTYTTSGTYTWSGTNATGCDSTATLNLTVNHPTTSTTTTSACDSLVWNHTTYTTSGTYTWSGTNAVGCDSSATLNLTINHSSTSSTTTTVCDSLIWNGTKYTASGVYTYSTTNATGCDSTATLNLTVNYSSSSTSTVTVCDSLIWNGTIYRNSGTYTAHFTNAIGCDSTATLVLTVNYKPTVAPIVGLTNIEILAIGAGGGAGGPDGALGAGGGAGGAVYGAYTLNTTGSSIYTVGVGGAGGYGQGCAGNAAGGTAGANGGGAGGNAGSGGCSGGGGGSGGWSGLYQGSNYIVVAGGGAGGGGSNEGTANDVTTPGGGNQSAAFGTSMTGQNGTAYSGDGGGGGAGGGGFYGGAGQSNLNATGTTASQAWGGANYANPTGRNSFATYIGNDGATASTGTGGQGTTSAISNSSNFNYSNTYGKGGNAQGNGGTATTANGNNGVVIIRYPGSPVATGGTVTQSGGYTLHTYTSAGSNTFTANSGNSVCAGSTTSLNCATTGGVWSSSDTTIATINSSTGLVTGKVAGTVTITYTVTNAQGCVGSSTKSFTVNPLPIVPAITGNTTICDNTTTILSNTLTGGIWSSSLPAKATINASTGLVIGVAAGNSTITYLYTDNNGCSNTNSTVVTINASPTVAAIGGNSGVCIGSTTTFTNATTGGTWSSGTTSVATINSSGLISTVATGSSTISYTVINASACTTFVTKSITVNALPNVTANATATTVCYGTQTTLTGGNASTYTWTNGVTNGVAFAPTATNSYTVTGTDGNGCVKTANITINVNPLPIVSISPSVTTICNGYSSTLTASGANTYSWTGFGTSPVIDQISVTPRLAVGLHKLRSSYSGSAIRIRRSSDNAEQDFGFSGNDLDVAAINTFVGAGTGYVKTLYDQSGNGNHLSQATNGAQPLFISSGLNGKPVIRIQYSVGQTLYNTTNFGSPFTVIYAAKQTGSTRGRMVTSTSGNWLLGWWGGNKNCAYFEGWVNNGATANGDNNPYVYTGAGTSGSYQLYQNGSLIANNSGGSQGPNGISMGANGCCASERSDGDFTDLYVFNSVLNTTNRQLVENNTGAYYGISGVASVLGTTQVATPSSTTTYTVYGTDANSCVGTATQTITVNPKPNAGADITNACGGSTQTLTGTANTGTWTALSTNPSGSTLSSTTSGVATVSFVNAATGTYSFIYTLPSTNCSDTMNIVVGAKPNAGSDVSNICGGNIITLTGAPNTGSWSAMSTNPAGGSSADAPFSASNSSLKLWIDATKFSTSNGNSLSGVITDASSYARGLTTNATFETAGFNGKPSVRYNNNQTATTTAFNTDQNTYVYTTVELVSTGTSWASVFYHWNRDGFTIEQNGQAASNVYHFQTGNDNSSCDQTISFGTKYIMAATLTGGIVRNFTLYKDNNGTLQNLGTVSNSSYSLPVALGNLFLGKSDNGEYTNMRMGEFIYFQGSLPVSESSIINYLYSKWFNVSGNLTTTSGSTTINFANAATGTYNYIYTSPFGCTDTTSVFVTPKPNAGADINYLCGGATQVLNGTTTNGTWTAMSTNPTGATLGSTTSGSASVTFANLASGTYNFIYTLPTNCSDTMSITVRPKPNAGADQAVCILNVATGVTLTSNVTGVWSAKSGNAGTSNILSPNSASTQVNNFSVVGDYNYINTNNGCTDTVKVTVTPAGSIGNYVWKDQNNDGLQNEPTANGVNGITVELYQKDVNGNFNLYTSTSTTNNGSGNPGYYNFGICEDGVYKVKFPTINPYTQTHLTTQDSTASTDGNSDANPATGYTREITIDTHGTGVSKDNNTIDAGYQICTKPDAGNDFSACAADCINITGTSTTPALPTTDGTWSAMFGNPSGSTLGSTTLGVAQLCFSSSISGVYNYLYTVTGGCEDTLTVTVNPLPAATISGTTAVCNNANSPIITFVGSNATSPYIFTYTINGGSPLTVTSTGDTARVTVSTSTPGTYVYAFVSVRDASSTTCLNAVTGSATVTVNPLPAAAISGTTAVCRNSSTPSILFTGSNATAPYTFTYTINGGSQQTVTTTSGDTVSVSVPTGTVGTYVYALVSVQDASSTTCLNAASGSATVIVNPLPTATIAGTTIVCRNSSSPNITFTGANATAPYTFTYTINGGSQQTVTTTSGNSVTVAVPTGTVGNFVYALVSVRDASSTTCLNTAIGSATVRVNPLPNAAISGTTTICQNSTSPNITFAGSNATAPYTFTYTINGGSQRTVTTAVGSATVTVAVPTNTAGTFVYSLVSVRDASSTACLNAASGSATVVINPLPTATISGTTTVCQYQATPSVTFTGANATAPYTFTYTINGGSQQTVTTTSGNSVTVAAPTDVIGTFTYALVSVRESSSTTCLNTPTTSATITVQQKPDAGSDIYQICGGSIIPVTGTPVGGTWSQLSSNAFGATVGTTSNGVANISFANLDSVTYTFVYTLSSGCTDTMTISTKPKPNAGLDKYLECGSTQRTDAISATPTGGLWTSQSGNPTGIVLGSTVSGNAGLSLPTAPATGTWYYIYTAPNACTDTMKYTIGVNGTPAPAINGGSNPICNTATVQLCPTIFGWSNYQWYRNGVAIPGQRGAGACITIDTSNIGSYTVSGTNGSACWSSQSTPIVISASAPATPTISVTGSANVCSGSSVTLTSSAASGNQWRKDGVVISGATSQTYIATASGVYTVTVTTCGSSTSAGTTITVASPITVAAISSSSNSVCLGSSITLTDATASGVWSSSNTSVAIINSSGVVTPVTSGTTVISYIVTVGSCSNAATYSLSVQNGSPAAPTIIAQSSTTLCGTNTVQLCPSVYGWSNYQWYKNGVAVTTNGASACIVIDTSKLGSYTLSVTTGTCWSAQSNSITISTTAAPSTPTISVSGSANVCAGGSVTLTSSAISGNQWNKNGVAISGATSQTYTATTSGVYTVTVTACGSTTSAGTTVTVASPITVAAIVSSSGNVCTGSTISLTDATTGGVWSSSNTSIATINSSGIVTPVSTGTVTITYTVTVGSCSQAVTTNLNIINSSSITPPTIAAQSSTSLCGTNTVQLCPTAYGWSNYQWYKNGVAVTTNGASACIVIDTSKLGNYTLAATMGTCWSAQSNAITISTTAAPATPIISTSGSTNVCSGASVTLTSSATSGNQWNKDGVAISGATSQTYSATASGVYTVTVTACGSTTSAGTTVTVASPITVAAVVGSNSVCLGSSTTLTNATAGGVWSSSNTSVATINSLGVVTSVAAGSTIISYTVTVGSCSGTSTYNLTIQNAVTTAPTLDVRGSTVLCGTTILQICPATYGWSNYQWYKNGVAIAAPTGTGACINIDTSALGSYTLTGTNGYGCWSSPSTAVVVTRSSTPATPTVSASGSTSICSGASVTLTSNATSGNQWNKDGIAISGATSQTYAATASGVYTVTVTVCGSTTSAGTTVTVASPIIVAAINSSANSICSGASVTMANATTGGFWSSSNTSVATVNGSGVVTTLSAGNTTISYTKTVGGCSAAATFTLSVLGSSVATPTLDIRGSVNICGSGSLQMCPLVWGYSNYQWYKDGVPYSTASCITVNTAGAYTLTGTNGSGCWSAPSAPANVTLNAIPTVAATTGATSVCVGSTTTLSNTTTIPSGGTGVWSTPSSSLVSVNASTGVVRGLNSGSSAAIYYTVTSAVGCSNTAVYTINVKAIPSVPNIAYAPGTPDPQYGAPSGSFCANKTFTVVGNPTGGVWSKTGVISVTTPGGVLSTGSVAGSFTITYTYTDANGCSNGRTIAANVAICAGPRGIASSNNQLVSSNDFTLYPNPARTTINLNVKTLVGSGTIVVTDLYGKQVKAQALSMGNNTIDVSNLAKGFYLVSMITSEGKTTKKLVVE